MFGHKQRDDPGIVRGKGEILVSVEMRWVEMRGEMVKDHIAIKPDVEL